MTPSRPKAAMARSKVPSLSDLGGEQFGDEIVDQPLVVAREIGLLVGADGVDDLRRETRLARQRLVHRPGIFHRVRAAHHQGDQFDQPFVEPGMDAKAIGQPVGGLGDVGRVHPHRKRAAQLAARPRVHDVVVELLLPRVEIFPFDFVDARHRGPPISILRSRRRGSRRRSARPNFARLPCRRAERCGRTRRRR